MAAYKRSDPTKLAKDREEIARHQAAQGPGLFERVIGEVVERVAQRKRKRQGLGSVPRVEGAMQHGRKPPGRTT